MEQPTSDLENACIVSGCLYGDIWNDSTKRFPDGTPVKTSPIRANGMLDGELVFGTMNTRYTAKSWRNLNE